MIKKQRKSDCVPVNQSLEILVVVLDLPKFSNPFPSKNIASLFVKIFLQLCVFRWVNQKAIIMTDFTVERAALEELGFRHVVQKNLNSVAADDRLNNRTIMEYLRKTVPKVFQNTLSLLSTATIQQFLDELVWREIHGQTSSDAFHNIIRDISSQARAET
jgi:hypothetical protein